MILTEVTASGLCCIEHAELEIPPGLALVCGDNGSGKTSMLSPRALGTRAMDFRAGPAPRSTWNPTAHVEVVTIRSGSAG
jgi:predicted ATPase